MHEFLQHTADVRLVVRAASFSELLSEAALAMAAFLTGGEIPIRSELTESVNVESGDRTFLLVDFLNEVLTLSHIHRAIFVVTEVSADATRLQATLQGRPAVFLEDLKAVTYHEAEVKENDDGSWETRLVFDI